MLHGVAPFYSENENRLYEKILNEDVEWMDCSEKAQQLIRKLLAKYEDDRGDIDGVLEDPWLKG